MNDDFSVELRVFHEKSVKNYKNKERENHIIVVSYQTRHYWKTLWFKRKIFTVNPQTAFLVTSKTLVPVFILNWRKSNLFIKIKICIHWLKNDQEKHTTEEGISL